MTVYIAYSKCLGETVLFILCCKLTFALPHNGASGEGNGTPLQYSCLENPMDRGAW